MFNYTCCTKSSLSFRSLISLNTYSISVYACVRLKHLYPSMLLLSRCVLPARLPESSSPAACFWPLFVCLDYRFNSWPSPPFRIRRVRKSSQPWYVFFRAGFSFRFNSGTPFDSMLSCPVRLAPSLTHYLYLVSSLAQPLTRLKRARQCVEQCINTGGSARLNPALRLVTLSTLSCATHSKFRMSSGRSLF